MTDASADELPLAAEFPPATREQWRKLVEGVLKGAPFSTRLVAKTYDGLAIEPLQGRKAQARPIPGRAPGASWSIVQRVDHPDATAANAEALHDLENGATGLSLVFAGAVGAYDYGLTPDAEAMARALDGVFLDAGIDLDLDPGPQSEEVGRLVAALLKRRGIAPAAASIRFGFDPMVPLRWPDRARSLERPRAELRCRYFKFGRARFSRAVCAGRRPGDTRCRWLAGSGTGLRACGGRRISARARTAAGSRSMLRAA